MADQPRWPRGTPGGGHAPGPGPGRFRDLSPDWFEEGIGGNAMYSMDVGSHSVDSRWSRLVSARIARYRPSQWEATHPGEHMRDRWAELVDYMVTHDGMSERAARSAADEMLYEATPPRTVYRNGPHEVVIEDGAPDIPEQDLLQFLDDLIGDFPPPPGKLVRLSIAPEGKFYVRGGLTMRPSVDDDDEGDGDVPFSRLIILGADIFSPGYVADHAMPILRQGRVEPWRYVLAHEWGHTLTSGVDSQHLADHPALSSYAHRGGFREAVAEGFAEWYLTDGETDNPAALAYAEHYGWGAFDG